jgi:nicotinamidase-related amidase
MLGRGGPLLVSRPGSCLLVVDLQQRLMPAIADAERVVATASWMIRLAREFDVPVRVSEHCPEAIGTTLPSLRSLLLDDEVLPKVHFSCMESTRIRRELSGLGRRQVIMVGAEAHVCVLQTALGLLRDGYEVFVLSDGVSSRRPADAALALDRLRQAGVSIVNAEMVAFEWLERADTELFKRVLKRYIR